MRRAQFETAATMKKQQRQDGRPRRDDCEFAAGSPGRPAAGGSRNRESSVAKQDPDKHRVKDGASRVRMQARPRSLERKLPLRLTPA